MSSLAMAHTASTRKGFDKRQMIIEAAATLLREGGPEAVSHRSVAKLAGCSLSATTYYFDGLEDLLHQAGLANMSRWSERAERAAFRARKLKPSASVAERIDLILAATLPDDENIKGHYEQLVSAGSAALVASAYQFGRVRLNIAVTTVLSEVGVDLPAEVVIALVDGAAVSALSEGRDVHETAIALLESALYKYWKPGIL